MKRRTPVSEENGRIIAEGKTKIIREIAGSPDRVLIESKDDITAGDGERRDVIEGKGILATETTCNCFDLLNSFGVPTHFLGRVNWRTFRAAKSQMVPIELVARRVATGSYLKRHPDIKEGTIFSSPVIEFFLKDDSCHDPLMLWSDVKRCFELYDSRKPAADGYLADLPADTADIPRNEMEMIALRDFAALTFEILEMAWASQFVVLVDLKIECGYTASGRLVVADVIDNDSWRIWPGGDKRMMKDKQVYRNLATITPADKERIRENYLWAMEATKKFNLK